jgi:mannobiose 2-epimerase
LPGDKQQKSFYNAGKNKPFTVDSLEVIHQSKDFDSVKNTLSLILTNNILDFWYPGVIDDQSGGYCLNCDVNGVWSQSSRKNLIGQSRTLWFFSRMAQTKYAEEKYTKVADHGYDYLKNFWDNENGGFYWEIDAETREPTMAKKHLCAQSYALFALAGYALCSKQPAAIELASKQFSLIEQHAYDVANGGYSECFDEYWNELSTDESPYLGLSPSFKTFNTYIHLVEAISEYYRLTRDSLAEERLQELLELFQNKMMDKKYGTCLNHFSKNWIPARGSLNKRISYGHDLENLWLSVKANNLLGLSLEGLIPSYQRTFGYTLKYGYDRKKGGVFDHGPIGKKANAHAKVWWSQAEALVAALEIYQITQEKVYLDFFLNTLDWVVGYQIDWSAGEWHQRVYRRGKIQGAKAEAWKTPYHNGRAMIHCLELLNEFE